MIIHCTEVIWMSKSSAMAGRAIFTEVSRDIRYMPSPAAVAMSQRRRGVRLVSGDSALSMAAQFTTRDIEAGQVRDTYAPGIIPIRVGFHEKMLS